MKDNFFGSVGHVGSRHFAFDWRSILSRSEAKPLQLSLSVLALDRFVNGINAAITQSRRPLRGHVPIATLTEKQICFLGLFPDIVCQAKVFSEGSEAMKICPQRRRPRSLLRHLKARVFGVSSVHDFGPSRNKWAELASPTSRTGFKISRKNRAFVANDEHSDQD